MVALTFGMNAQSTLDDISAKYIEIVSISKPLETYNGMGLYIDYGQIKDKKSAKAALSEFDLSGTGGLMGLINLLDTKGYKYVSQTTTKSGTQNIEITRVLLKSNR